MPSLLKPKGARGMNATTLTAGSQSKWFSSNPDKAFAEKLFLSYLVFFLAWETLLQTMGWVNVNDYWGSLTTLITWMPYLVILPAFLRRHSAGPEGDLGVDRGGGGILLRLG